jgi:hypothetical protein
MTTKTTACAVSLALLAGTAAFAAPAAAGYASTQVRHPDRQFSSTLAVYDAGLRHGAARASRSAYLRGFRDGTSSEAYSGRYRVNSYPVVAAMAYPSYDGGAGYAPESGGYASFDDPYGGGPVAFNENAYGYSTGGYVGGHALTGLMDVAVEPMAMTAAPVSRTAQWSYCAARYQSFDPASGTFLAFDGNHYFCR